MKKQRKFYLGNDLITAIALLLLGILFIVYKGGIISIAMSIVGGVLLALGILDLVRGFRTGGVIKTVLGVLVLVAGWTIISVALYILAAFLLIAGISELRVVWQIRPKKMKIGYIAHLLQPIVYIMVAICLLFNQGGAISWVFYVSGIFLIIDGVIALVGALDRK